MKRTFLSYHSQKEKMFCHLDSSIKINSFFMRQPYRTSCDLVVSIKIDIDIVFLLTVFLALIVSWVYRELIWWVLNRRGVTWPKILPQMKVANFLSTMAEKNRKILRPSVDISPWERASQKNFLGYHELTLHLTISVSAKRLIW